jgi:hypothetical protein
MDKATEEHLELLQGRIIALEELVTGLLTIAALNADPVDPVDRVRRMRATVLGSLQNVDRPIDEVSDRIWGHAVDALNRRFDNIAKRVAGV